jgi:hypothetical protein
VYAAESENGRGIASTEAATATVATVATDSADHVAMSQLSPSHSPSVTTSAIAAAPSKELAAPWKRGAPTHPADADDRRSCTACAHLSPGGTCGAAWARGRRYSPMLDPPRRCAEFRPKASGPDQRSGRERWPWLRAPCITNVFVTQIRSGTYRQIFIALDRPRSGQLETLGSAANTSRKQSSAGEA